MPPFGGALMQIVAYGAQDVYLSGNSLFGSHYFDTYVNYKFKRTFVNFEINTKNKLKNYSYRDYVNFNSDFDSITLDVSINTDLSIINGNPIFEKIVEENYIFGVFKNLFNP